MNKMYIELKIQPRQTGKSKYAMSIFEKNPNDTLLITIKKDICNGVNIILPEKFKPQLLKKYKTIILDEYLYFDNRIKIYKDIKLYGCDELYILNTPNKTYDFKLFHFIKAYKNECICEELYNIYNNQFPTNTKDFEELYYNFLTNSDIDLYELNNNNLNEIKNLNQDENELKCAIGEKSFDLEYKLKYII